MLSLLADLRNGRIPSEGEYGAKSTLAAILGRLAAYSGQPVRWDDALASDVSLANTDLLTSLSDAPPVLPDECGDYPVAVPGSTQTV
jgi:hypothetical protein